MKCNIQNTLEIQVPDEFADLADPFNNEWGDDDGQAWETKNFIEVTKDKKVIIDVGAHIGFFSFCFIVNNNADATKKAHSFEPSPWGAENFLQIKDYNNEDKRFDNISFYNRFMGDTMGEKRFVVEEGAMTFAVLYERDDPFFKVIKSPDESSDKKTIDVVTVDNFSACLEKNNESFADVIKIDVEGFDCRVLQGAITTLKETRPLVLLEVHQRLLRLYNNTVMNVYELMSSELDYDFYDNKMNKIEDKDSYIRLFKDKSEIRLICNPKEAGNL